MNGQQVSVVVVQDAARRARIAELAGDQAWIARAPVFLAVIMDFHKTALAIGMAGRQQLIHESVEGLLMGGVDCGIALGHMMTAARSLGLDVVPIGGIRRNPQAMIELLQLPDKTFPLVGLCVGHIDQAAAQKPRLPEYTFRHDERYDASRLAGGIAEYDHTLMQHWQKIGQSDGLPWTSNLARSYARVYYPDVRPAAASQGLLGDK